ncbi:uncharacterized protein LOC135956510 [Calliphora vicina]|uniref:uncharacterized protein LOC135956510 n=1 Tax=Calliphora vicina TaxID=7373 RepID=UPI00325B1493
MESDYNLESIREISESQLEALLRFDSPPETPNEQPNHITLSGGYIQEDYNNSKFEDDGYSYNSCILHNREPFVSQLDSEIDFSTFHHHSSNLQWRLSALNTQHNENDDSIIVTTSCTDKTTLDPIEISDLSIGDNNKSHAVDENFLEFDIIEKSSPIKLCNSPKQNINLESVKDNTGSQTCSLVKKSLGNDFEEIDTIFQKIDFEIISNLEESYLNEVYDQNRIQTQYQTQSEYKTSLINSHPAPIRNHHPVDCRSSISRSSFHKDEFVENIDHVQLPDILMRDDDQENNIGTNICLSLDKNLDVNFDQIDDIFETLDFGDISDHSRSIQGQIEYSQNHVPSTQNHSTNFKAPETHPIPFTVRQLHEIVKTKYSDFAFIYALSCQLCQDRVPMECFVTLKMALLLSLVSIGNNVDRHPIPIVAMTNDTYMTDYLMTNIGQLGSRFLGPVDCVKSSSSHNWIEADPIILARGGVYYAGDWTRLKLIRTDTIFKNIECSSGTLGTSNLDTAIWTHWRSFKHSAKEQKMFNKFLKIFGIPIFVSEDNHESLVDYTLEQASVRIFESTSDHLSINEDDMRSFLVYVSQNNVDLSPEAALLLKNYFVTSRSSRQDCLTKQSYVILKQFAESFAKLSMRKEVSSDDALAAIILCEHFIENVFSSTDNPPPHFGNFTFVGAVDKYCIQFKEWLNSYLEKWAKE